MSEQFIGYIFVICGLFSAIFSVLISLTESLDSIEFNLNESNEYLNNISNTENNLKSFELNSFNLEDHMESFNLFELKQPAGIELDGEFKPNLVSLADRGNSPEGSVGEEKIEYKPAKQVGSLRLSVVSSYDSDIDDNSDTGNSPIKSLFPGGERKPLFCSDKITGYIKEQDSLLDKIEDDNTPIIEKEKMSKEEHLLDAKVRERKNQLLYKDWTSNSNCSTEEREFNKNRIKNRQTYVEKDLIEREAALTRAERDELNKRLEERIREVRNNNS